MTEIRQLCAATPLRPATPQCEATRENRYYSDPQGAALPRCSHSSSYMLEGRHLCARHAGAVALRILLANEGRPNKWREAVLDRVAVQCWDPEIGTPARVVVDRMLEIEVSTALDPAVSERAAALVATPSPREETFASLLEEVRSNFTTDDDLPDNLLPRIDGALDEIVVDPDVARLERIEQQRAIVGDGTGEALPALPESAYPVGAVQLPCNPCGTREACAKFGPQAGCQA